MVLFSMTTLFNKESKSAAHISRPIQQSDTYLGMIGIYNIFSACMSHNPDDFIGQLHECKRVIKELGGQIHFNIKIGTLK